ncbi:hypothetical protein WK10_17340 [Burkholderia ubonensis]|nr:hypothetical protein WK10_17340 [Burkholderia ubonensis]
MREGDAAMRSAATRNDPRGTTTCTKRIVARASISMAAAGGAAGRRYPLRAPARQRCVCRHSTASGR